MPSQALWKKAAGLLRETILLSLLLFIALLPLPAAAEPDGLVINDDASLTITGEGVRVVAVQPWDGKILLGGSFTVTEWSTVWDWDLWAYVRVSGRSLNNLVRLNNDGTLDPTFAPEPGAAVNAIAIEQDKSNPLQAGQSRIYVGGEFHDIAGVTRYGLARLSGENGALDPLFAPATASDTVIESMLLQGKRIVLGGSFGAMGGASELDGEACSNLAAVSVAAESDGALVETFSGGTDGAVKALLWQDGYLLAGGAFTSPRKYLARFEPDDRLDVAFSAEPGGAVRALALQPDAMVLIGGDFTAITTSLAPLSPQPRHYLARLTSDGRLDPFDAALEPFEPSGENYVASIAMQPDGKILAAGRFTRSTGDSAKPQQHHFARFSRSGAFDNGIDTGTDQPINVIALEPNGRFLIGGEFASVVTGRGVRSRARIARFYFTGWLDDDGAPFPPEKMGHVITAAVHPDGSVTAAGALDIGVPDRTTVIRLKPDLSLDPSYETTLFDHRIFHQSIKPDGKLLTGGAFTLPQPLFTQLTEKGALDSTFRTFLADGPQLVPWTSRGSVALMLPKVSRTSRPVGTMASEGMMYAAMTRMPVGGSEEDKTTAIVRLKANGDLDPAFTPLYVDGLLASAALQEDGKVVIGGTFPERVMRLHSNGDIDSTFRPWRPNTAGYGGGAVDGIVVQKDGKVVICGYWDELISPDDPQVTIRSSSVARLNSDGSIDGGFTVFPYYFLGAFVQGVVQLSDGGFLLYGIFDEVEDVTGVYPRTGTVQLSRDGKVVGKNLLEFRPRSVAYDNVATVAVQPDGKVLIGGTFNRDWDSGSAPLNRLDAKVLTRVANILWATEEVVVAPDGSAVTWLRGGSGPELWQVWFEEKSDEPGAEWSYMGAAEPADGGWKLGLPPSGRLPVKQHRYVRARGYAKLSGINTGHSELLESVRYYYLKEPVRVKAQPETKVYGRANPPSYTATYLDRWGQPKVLEPGTFHGIPTFGTPATERSGVGDYPIIADVSAMTSPLYSFIPEDGTLTVTRKTLTVTALDATSLPGVANRTFTAGYSGFVGSDTKENSVEGEPQLTTVADAQSPPGSYVIVAALGTLRSSNYQFAFQNGTLTIGGRLSQQISFQAPGAVTYGDSALPIVASSNRGLQLTFESSDSTVAVVQNGMIVPKRAGSTLITARQGGNQAYEAATPVSHTFTVRRKELKVSADPKARAYRTPNPTFTLSYQGFVNGENSSVISGTPQLTTNASLESPVGSYPISLGLGSLRADNYSLTPVNGTLTVLNSCQEIVFPAIGERTYGDAPLEIIAVACSGLNLTFASSETRVATVTGNVLTITGAGTSVITASQRGTGDIDPARPVSQTLVVHKRGQAITFAPLPPKVFGNAPIALQAAASSGLPVSFSSSDESVAAVSGSTLTIAGGGTTVITARQEGDVNYEAALPASHPFTVALEGEPPLLTLSTLPSGSATASPVLNVSGSARDASGITSLTVNSADLTAAAALFSSAVPLNVGENSITVTAKDGAGNVASETLSVTLDAAAPLLAVTEPADNSVTDASLFSVRGRVPAGSSVAMAVNGAAPQAVAVSSEGFNGTGYLQNGINTVELTAELSGRSARAKRTVTLTEGAPPVAITEPGEDLRTEADSVLIKGRAGSGNIGSATLEVNGVPHPVAVEGGSFQKEIELHQPGDYRIKVTATDSAGNSSSAWRNIIKVVRIAGDVNLDGVVDIGDAIALLRVSLGIDPATGEAIAHGDLAPVVNGVSQPDGKIGIGDVLILLRKVVGLIE